jgi:SAM-dependent methyltransferase
MTSSLVAISSSITHPEFAPILADAGLDAAQMQSIDPAQFVEERESGSRMRGDLFIGPLGTGLDIPAASRLYRRHGDPRIAPTGAVLFYLKAPRQTGEFVRWRNALWPWLHVVALYRIEHGTVLRETLQGQGPVTGRVERDGYVLLARRREHVLSPQATVEKFDQNAGGWNGDPKSAGYGHFRWMRRYVGSFERAPKAARILDFGCGAGWVGIEAALTAPDSYLAAFDPSSEMVRLAGENARASGVARFEGRVGFGEDPPFPRAGEAPFELVISSGVVSFAPDRERWLDGLVRTLAPGGTLVVGDIQRASRGMLRRRGEKLFLPARELNASTRAEIQASLEQRGLRVRRSAGYQLTRPVPQLMHWSETRGGGLLSPLLLALNRALAGRLSEASFDSWVLSASRPG